MNEKTVEETVSCKLGEVRKLVEERMRDGEEYVRSEPLQAIAYALAAGYVIRILPVGKILRGVIGLGVAALKPAGLLYGAAKAYELLQHSNRGVENQTPTNASSENVG